MKRFILFCSGVDKSVLRLCPTETTKFISLGLSVFLTALLAVVSGGYAIYFVFNNIIVSSLFGVLWGFIIFNLDRYIVSTGNNIVTIIPRILISIILSITISKPLELKLFEGSVLKVINEQNQFYKDSLENLFIKNKAKLLSQIKEAKSLSDYDQDKIFLKLNNKYSELLKKKESLRKDTSLYSRRLIKSITSELSILNADIKARNNELIKKFKVNEKYSSEQLAGLQKQLILMDSTHSVNYVFESDILVRLKALSALKNKDSTANIASNFITMLFVLIEVSPVLIKIMTNNDVYKQALNEQELINKGINSEMLSFEKKRRDYRLTIMLKTNQTSVDYLEKKRLYLTKVEIDKWYDEQLKIINKI